MSYTYDTSLVTFPFPKEQGEALVSTLTEQAVALVTANDERNKDNVDLLDEFYYETDEEREEQLSALREALEALLCVEDKEVSVYYHSEEHSQSCFWFACEALSKALPEGAYGVERQVCSDSKAGNFAWVYFLTADGRVEAESFFSKHFNK